MDERSGKAQRMSVAQMDVHSGNFRRIKQGGSGHYKWSKKKRLGPGTL